MMITRTMMMKRMETNWTRRTWKQVLLPRMRRVMTTSMRIQEVKLLIDTGAGSCSSR